MGEGYNADPLDTRPELSLFVPFYDEEDSLPVAVEAALAMLASTGRSHELILVDDGSTDGSAAIADRAAADHDAVRVARHEVNRGYGAALCTGFAEALGDLVLYSDADLPVALHHFADALPRLERVDLVTGYPLGWDKSLRRKAYTAGYKLLCRVFLGLSVRDINFSFKIVRRELLTGMELDARTGLIDAQFLAEAVRLGARIEEIGVPYTERVHGVSHFDSPAVAFANGIELLQLWRRNRGRP